MAFPMRALIDDLLLKSISDMGEGVLVLDFPRFVYTNEAFQKLSGYSESQLSDLPTFFDLVAPSDLVRVEEHLQHFRAGQEPREHIEFHLQKSNGRSTFVEAVFSRWPDEGPARVIGLVREVSKKHAMSRIDKSFQFLFEKSPNPMLVYDSNTRAILAVNDAIVGLYGYSREEFKALNLVDLVATSEIEHLTKNLDFIREKNAEYFCDPVPLHHRRKDGSLMEVGAVCQAIEYAGLSAHLLLIQDVTSGRKVERALADSQQRLRAVFESGIQGIYLFALTGRILEMNPTAIKIGKMISEHDLRIGDVLEEYMPVGSRMRFHEDFRKAAAGEPLRVEFDAKITDGTVEWYEALFNPVTEKDGRISGVCMSLFAVSDRKKAEDQSRQNEELFKLLFNNANDAIYLYEVNADGAPGKYIEVNEVACHRMGYTHDEFLNMTPLDILEPKQRRDMVGIWRKLAAQSHMTFERVHLTHSAVRLPVEVSAHMFQLGGRSVVLSIARDLTERKRAEEIIRRQAYYDPLTNLPNRTLFKDRLEQAMAHAKRSQQTLSVMLLDLDRFKTINETLGHNLGDRLLVGVAERLLAQGGEGATLARLTGDEFIFLIPQVENTEEVYQHAARIIQSLKDPFHLGTQEVHTSCGLGIVMYPGDGEDTETLLRNAETAMYRAKEQGRNNYQLYTAVMNAKAFKQLLMENSMRRALERNEFIVHYQPQVDIETRRVVGCEALVRWQHPDLGLVFPTEFIGLAEDTGLIVPLGEWVLKESCRQAKAWQMKGLPPITVAVNLSGRQFQQKSLANRVAEILKETGLDAQWLGLEITESVALKDADFTLASLHDFRTMGLHLALDDFGTGYSSLSYLKRFPIQTIKIDQSFVRDLVTDPNDAAIAEAVMALSHSLKLTVVAEGVETEEQLEFLRARGCRYVQGYLMSHPLPAEEFERFLSQPQVIW